MKKLFILFYVLISVIPFIGMCWYQTDMSVEKRIAAKTPELFTDNRLNAAFFDEVNNWFSDHFAYRQEFATADAVIRSKVFHTSANKKVVVGKKNWLYFAETMDDYYGRNTLTSRGVHNCAKVLSLMEENVEKQGCQFVYICAPNKNSLYPENMPNNAVRETDYNNWSLLQQELEQQRVSYINLHDVLGAEQEVIYHKWDSHWNNKGAAIVCDSVLSFLRQPHVNYREEPYVVKRNFFGDLYGMLYPKGTAFDENVMYQRKHTYSYRDSKMNVEDMLVETECEEGTGSLLMFRDSFGNALIPFVADAYADGYYSKQVPYDLTLLQGRDTVIVELAERHIRNLQKYLPVSEAPVRAINEEMEEVDGSYELDFGMPVRTESGELMPVYGQVDAHYTGDDSPVYIRIYAGDGYTDYEAYPANYGYGEIENPDYRYGMYINLDKLTDIIYEFEIITKRGETYYRSGIINTFERGK